MADRARLRDLAALAARLVAGGIWIVAGVAKALDFDSFHLQLQGYDVLPQSTVSWVTYGLPVLEIALGAYLVVGLLVRPAAWLSVGLMTVFIVAQGQAWARGLHIDCGCFGRADVQTVGPRTILRDLALAAPSVLVLCLGEGRYSLERVLHTPRTADEHGDAAAVGADPGHDHLW